MSRLDIAVVLILIVIFEVASELFDVGLFACM